MNYYLLVLFTVLFNFNNAYSNLMSQNRPMMENARFILLKFDAKSGRDVLIQSFKCDPNRKELEIQKFESLIKEKDASINIIHAYIRSGDCKKSSISSVWEETIHLPKNGNDIHLYITLLSDNVMVL